MGSNLGEGRIDPQFKKHVKDQFSELEDLLRAAESAQGLLAHPGWPVLQGLIEAEVAEIDAGLDGRLLETRADYASRHGRRGGLRAPELALHALISHAESRFEEQRAKHEGVAEPALGGV